MMPIPPPDASSNVSTHHRLITACEARLPFLRPFITYMARFPMPPVSWLWCLGACLIVALLLMVTSGLFLAITYTPDSHSAFSTVEEIERRIPSGWFVRGLHIGGATMLFAALYAHIGRGLWYGSYKAPRELVWLSGLFLFLLFMMTSFAGYILPWGQMSYWGAIVITHAVAAVPGIGKPLVSLLMGSDTFNSIALHRLFILHITLGFMAVMTVGLHVVCLHGVGPTNPTLDSPRPNHQTRPFHPFHTVKDAIAVCLFLAVLTVLIFFTPDLLQGTNNLVPANPLKTPSNITPEWYLAPFFAMLRAVPSRLGGLFIAAASILILFALPWLDRSPRHNARYRPAVAAGMICSFIAFVILILAGLHEPTPVWTWLSRAAIIIWFSVPLLVMPLAARRERTALTPHTKEGAP